VTPRLQVLVSAGVWMFCIRRVHVMQGEIYQHLVAWERRGVGEEEPGENGLADADVDAEFNRYRRARERARAELEALRANATTV